MSELQVLPVEIGMGEFEVNASREEEDFGEVVKLVDEVSHSRRGVFTWRVRVLCLFVGVAGDSRALSMLFRLLGIGEVDC